MVSPTGHSRPRYVGTFNKRCHLIRTVADLVRAIQKEEVKRRTKDFPRADHRLTIRGFDREFIRNPFADRCPSNNLRLCRRTGWKAKRANSRATLTATGTKDRADHLYCD